MSQDLISPTKAGKTSKSKKEKPSEGSKLVEDIKSRKPSKKAKSMNITPQSIFPDAHGESDEAPNSSLKGNLNLGFGLPIVPYQYRNARSIRTKKMRRR